MTTLRELWDSGRPTIGAWCVMPSAFAAELAGRSGVDWVCIDTQHGLIGYEQMAAMLQALSGTGTPAFVRVPWNAPDHIMKALDAGAQGVVVPMVNSAEEARQAVDSARYPPAGRRSWGPIRAALDVPDYSPAVANRRVVLAVMIETAEGVQAADEILSVAGVDAVYVGPNDLALAHGLPPSSDVEAEAHGRLVESVREAAARHGVVAGIHCGSVETALRWRDRGFRMLNVMSDAVVMRQGLAAIAATVRGAEARPSTTGAYA
ncbi:MAG: aldolase/citrate lyase family protein [Candidatus Dormibacteraeota bacterium]|nr:aldolase/citrate lyase family protein [Candidatus Dormibacteraeota bacterium]